MKIFSRKNEKESRKYIFCNLSNILKEKREKSTFLILHNKLFQFFGHVY